MGCMSFGAQRMDRLRDVQAQSFDAAVRTSPVKPVVDTHISFDWERPRVVGEEAAARLLRASQASEIRASWDHQIQQRKAMQQMHESAENK